MSRSQIKQILKPVFISFFILALTASSAVSQVVVLGTRFGGTIGGLNFSSGDLVRYDMQTGEAEIFLPQSTFDNFIGSVSGRVPINLDALALVPESDSSFVFSARVGIVVNAQTVTDNGVTTVTNGDATTFSQRELILSDDLETSNVEVLFDVLNTDLSGVAILPNGNVLLAAKTTGSFRNLEDAGINYRVGDVIEYNLETGVGSIFFSTDNFFTENFAPGNIDALEILPNGNLLLSPTNNCQIGTSAQDAFTLRQGGMYEFNRSTGEVSTFLDPIVFNNSGTDLKAFSILPPSALIDDDDPPNDDDPPTDDVDPPTDDALIGDVDRNGVINFMDISPFTLVLLSGDYQIEADATGDGVVDFFDISSFVALLTLLGS